MRFALPRVDARPSPASDCSPTSGAAKLARFRGPSLSALIHGLLVPALLFAVFPNSARVAKPEKIPIEIVRLADLNPEPDATRPPDPKPKAVAAPKLALHPDPVEKVPPIDLTRPVAPTEKSEPPRELRSAVKPPAARAASRDDERKIAAPPEKSTPPESNAAPVRPDKHGIKVPPQTAAKPPTGADEPLVGHWVLDPLQIDLGHACGSQRLSGTIRIVRRDGERYHAQLRTTIHWSLCQPQGVLRRIVLRIHDGHVTMYDGGGVLDRGTIKDGVMVLRDAYGASVWRKIGK